MKNLMQRFYHCTAVHGGCRNMNRLDNKLCGTSGLKRLSHEVQLRNQKPLTRPLSFCEKNCSPVTVELQLVRWVAAYCWVNLLWLRWKSLSSRSPRTNTLTAEHFQLPQQQCRISGAYEKDCVIETASTQRSTSAIIISWLFWRPGK